MRYYLTMWLAVTIIGALVRVVLAEFQGVEVTASYTILALMASGLLATIVVIFEFFRKNAR